MKFKKPKFWDYKKPSILSYLFFPLSLLLTILKTFKNLTTKKKKYPKIKTICVGNIYLGGTGKTSLSLKINEILKDEIKTCFIKKYYRITENYLNSKIDLPQLNKQLRKILNLQFLMMVCKIHQ